MMRGRGKKGFIGDLGLVMAVLFIIALVVIIGYKIFDSYNDKWQTQTSVSNESKVYIQETHDRYVGLWDGIFMFVFALLTIALFVSATQLGTRPEFFFITLIVLVFMIGASAVISNSYETISTNDSINSTSSQFEFIPFIMINMPYVVLMFGFVIMMALFIKIRGFL